MSTEWFCARRAITRIRGVFTEHTHQKKRKNKEKKKMIQEREARQSGARLTKRIARER